MTIRLGRRKILGCSLAAALLLCGPSRLLAQTPSERPVQTEGQAVPSHPGVTPSFSQLFRDTLNDFRRLPSTDTFRWLGAGVAGAALAHVGDDALVNRMSGSAGLEETFEAGAVLGGDAVQIGGAFAAYAIGRLTTQPKVAIVGADLLQAQIVTHALTGGVKLAVRRTRPDGSALSFPSGHASASFATATVLQRQFGWKVGMPAYGVASYIALSRVQVKAHFLSDVAFGAALGIMAGRTVTVGRGRAQFAVSPLAVPGGGGAAFTWIGSR